MAAPGRLSAALRAGSPLRVSLSLVTLALCYAALRGIAGFRVSSFFIGLFRTCVNISGRMAFGAVLASFR